MGGEIREPSLVKILHQPLHVFLTIHLQQSDDFVQIVRFQEAIHLTPAGSLQHPYHQSSDFRIQQQFRIIADQPVDNPVCRYATSCEEGV